MAIAIVHGNQAFAKGFGYRDWEAKSPVTPRTLFYTADTTKSWIAALTSKLVDSKQSRYEDIDLDTKLVKLIPNDFLLQDEYATNHITLTDALSHRTGLPRHDWVWENGNPDLKEQVWEMRHLRMHRKLRAEWEYCNLMYSAVSLMLETVTGNSTKELLQSWLWKRLGLRDTFYDDDDALTRTHEDHEVNMAMGYSRANSTYYPTPLSSIPLPNGAFGVISTVLDYTHWLRTFLHPTNASNPISAETIRT
jgi:CubicO group peptidase (beta-lactamase class C family)